jgi:hypothetical protein
MEWSIVSVSNSVGDVGEAAGGSARLAAKRCRVACAEGDGLKTLNGRIGAEEMRERFNGPSLERVV